MKAITLFLMIALAGFAQAGFETWTNEDGRKATMKLIEVTEKDGEKVGKFRLHGGQTVELKASELSDDSAERLKNWKGNSHGKESVFDEYLEGNLKVLDGSRLSKVDDFKKPEKYYAFYYSASWCGPCRKFTPSLVKLYKEHKNDNFEIVLIGSDPDRKSMEKYVKDMGMPWPTLNYSDVQKFCRNFNHGVSGTPSLIVCKIDGKILGDYRSNLPGLAKLVKD